VRYHWSAFIIVLIILAGSVPATAQNSSRAWTPYAQAVYSSPDRASHIVAILSPRSEIVLEARDAAAHWVLGHSLDGSARGWVEIRHLKYDSEVNINSLPVSLEEMFVSGIENAAYHTIDLNDYPVIPTDFGRAREIFEYGKMRGLSPNVISKVGDCISDNQHFLSPFGWKQYNLGDYGQLQPVIDYFALSLAYDSQAAYNGLVTAAALDPAFANPMACVPGESPLRCEYRIHDSSVAIIMFGAQDLLFTTPEEFDRNLRQIIHETIQVGVVPILSTFPGNLEMWERSIQYNQIVVQVALDFDIPLMNLWRALDPLPNHGLNDDGRHLSQPITNSGDLSGPNLQRGYPLRNLITLQTLDAVWRGVMY